MKLKAEQQRLYDMLPKDVRCFVRVCDGDEALWVSDLPRRYAGDLAPVENAWQEKGFSCSLDTAAMLWYVDLTPQRWNEVLMEYPAQLPPFPSQDRYHAAYALCRLWLAHPAIQLGGSLGMVRRVIKLVEKQENAVLRAVSALHEEAACQLRRKEPCAHAAGCILARWLMERSETE